MASECGGLTSHSATTTTYKLVVVGAGAVGKSALTIQLVSNHFVSIYDPTIEDSYRTQVEVDGVPVVLDILDTAGQDDFSAMRDQYMHAGRGFVFVYAINLRSSFEDLPNIRTRLYKVKDKDYSERLPIVIAGNKVDLDRERHVLTAEGEKLAQQWGCKFVETSALTRLNVETAFFEVVRMVRQMDGVAAALGAPAPQKKKKLCTLL
eukprot:TRINITY_DN4720_c0_g1_i1.p1 TRINITY_DN4720_c0_g1~~TRINITY_DN4720_c0_g1_i1.p1  ORF type:complete len:207 (+),score=53.25 TRINITY_DN4720_c0_g1_i1:100-720(+)